jgi:predicted transcriptional regulator
MSTDSKILKLKIPVKSTYQRVSLWNGIYNLTDKEMTVLSSFIDQPHKEFCDRDHREAVSKDTEMPIAAINTYIKRLKDKKAVSYNDKKYSYSKLFSDFDGVEIDILR